jgi:hypothetical protein
LSKKNYTVFNLVSEYERLNYRWASDRCVVKTISYCCTESENWKPQFAPKDVYLARTAISKH